MTHRGPVDPIAEMRRLIYGNWQTMTTCAFAELGLADLLHGAPQTAEELASATETDPRALLRFLRCCGQLSFVHMDTKTSRFSLTPFGDLLRSDHPGSQRAAARLNGAPYRYEPWGKLVDILKSGSSKGRSPTFEEGSLAYLSDKPHLLNVFQRAMTDLSVLEDDAIAASYDFARFQHIVDVGCGRGTLIKAIMRAHPHLQGTMFDLTESLAEVDGPDDEFADRLSRAGGDFFESIPDCGDVYIMKNVVHNWPEAKVLTILKTARDAMMRSSPGRHKRLLIIEYLMPEGNEKSVVKWIDMNFFILVDGGDRTADEYQKLVARAGFDVLDFIETPVGRHIIELAPKGTPG